MNRPRFAAQSSQSNFSVIYIIQVPITKYVPTSLYYSIPFMKIVALQQYDSPLGEIDQGDFNTCCQGFWVAGAVGAGPHQIGGAFCWKR